MINIDLMPHSALQDALEEIARRAILLVACDFDGVLAESLDDPSKVDLDPEGLDALQHLAHLPCTHAAIVSGRSRAELLEATGHAERLVLVGSHGAELPGAAHAATSSGRLDALVGHVAEVASRWSDVLLVRRPHAVAIHHHGLSEPEASALIWSLLNGPARQPGVTVRSGPRVLELCTTDADKGVALATLRQRTGATATVFLGNDVAASDALRALGADDLGVSVGPPCRGRGGSRHHRVADVRRVSAMLVELARLRAEWSAGAMGDDRRMLRFDRAHADHTSDRWSQHRPTVQDDDRRLDLVAGRAGPPPRRPSCAMLSLVGPGGFAFA